MILEVIGYKGVVGNATYQWLEVMKPDGMGLIGRDIDDPLPEYGVEREGVISFVCTPETAVEQVCEDCAIYAGLIVVRSTVSPGTCKKLQEQVKVHVCHNPEFLREATAVQDIFNPSYILIGACCQKHGSLLKGLYKPACVKVVVTDALTSEFVKIATNNYLACLVSFWNEMEGIAQASGISGHRVGAIASLDPRVVVYGARWHHQFGGKCLPKELAKMIDYATQIGVKPSMLRAIQEVNECQTFSLPSPPTMSKIPSAK